MKKSYILLFLVIVLFLFGCSTKEQIPSYKDSIEKALNLNEYKIVYKFDSSSLSVLTGDSDTKIGYFKKNDKEKTVVEMNVYGTKVSSYIYIINNKTISCTKGNTFLGGSESDISCQLSTELSEFDSLMNMTYLSGLIDNTTNITYLGEENVINRSCYYFSLEITNMTKLLESSGNLQGLQGGSDSKKDVTAFVYNCVDKISGVSLNSSIVTKSRSELTGEEEVSPLMSFSAISYSETVDDSVFELPVNFAVSTVGCTDDEIVAIVEPFKTHTGNTEIKVLDSYTSEVSKTVTVGSTDFVAFTPKVVNAKYSSESSYYNTLKVCVDDKCSEQYCYVTDSVDCLKLSGNDKGCTNNKNCILQNGVCQEFACSLLLKEKDCKEYSSKCVWQNSSFYPTTGGYCTEITCYNLKDEESCTNNEELDCDWNDVYSSCETVWCYAKETQSECIAHKSCIWQYDSCSTNYNAQ